MTAPTSSELDEVIAAVLGVEAVSLNGQHGPWSSRKQLELAVALEKRFGLEFTSEEIFGARTLSALRELLRSKGVTS